jgi:hypothetical protein
VEYEFQPHLGSSPIPIDHIIDVDRKIRDQIDAATVKDFIWPRQENQNSGRMSTNDDHLLSRSAVVRALRQRVGKECPVWVQPVWKREFWAAKLDMVTLGLAQGRIASIKPPTPRMLITLFIL